MDGAAGGAAEIAPAIGAVFEAVAGVGEWDGTVIIFMLKLSACMLVLSSRLLVVYAVYILYYMIMLNMHFVLSQRQVSANDCSRGSEKRCSVVMAWTDA